MRTEEDANEIKTVILVVFVRKEGEDYNGW